MANTEWNQAFYEYPRYILQHPKQVAQLLTVIGKLVPPVFFSDEKRSLRHDFELLNSPFPTDVEIEGVDNLRQLKNSGFVLVMNHFGSTEYFPRWTDENASPLWFIQGIMEALNQAGIDKDPKLVLKKDDKSPLWWFKKKFIDSYDLIPVKPKEANGSIEEANAGIQQGDIVLISPEGNFSRNLTRFHKGVARFAPAKKPFVPVAYWEEPDDTNRSKFRLRIGQPIPSPTDVDDWVKLPLDQRKERWQELADVLGYKVADLLPRRLRGYYANPADHS